MNYSMEEQAEELCMIGDHGHTIVNFTAIMCFNLTEHKYYIYS